jgi:hypothetical protein
MMRAAQALTVLDVQRIATILALNDVIREEALRRTHLAAAILVNPFALPPGSDLDGGAPLLMRRRSQFLISLLG